MHAPIRHWVPSTHCDTPLMVQSAEGMTGPAHTPCTHSWLSQSARDEQVRRGAAPVEEPAPPDGCEELPESVPAPPPAEAEAEADPDTLQTAKGAPFSWTQLRGCPSNRPVQSVFLVHLAPRPPATAQ